MKLFTKEQLIKEISTIIEQGWKKSVKKTLDKSNDGAVGNTLEVLLGIQENNLPIPNASEWELKGQRLYTSSLVTLKHIEPSPKGAKIVSGLMLPYYGWKHKQAGLKYSSKEMSFRSTTYVANFTNRGFRITIDKKEQKVKFIFDSTQADKTNPEIASWLESVNDRIGLGPLNPEPYWGFDDLKYAIGSKIKNCFYIVADTKIESSQEYFLYRELYILSGFSFEKFLKCIEDSIILIDFDARTGHNHGTKFRIRQDRWSQLYSEVKRVI